MITVKGAPTARAVAEKLTTYAGAVGEQAEALAGERAQQIGEEARRYEPPPLPSYRRTGRLARSWRVEREGAGYRVGSDAPYARFVRGHPSGGGQVWLHVGRWRPLSDIAAQALDVREALVARLRGLLHR